MSGNKAALAVLFLGLGALEALADPQACSPDSVIFQTGGDTVTVRVELADDESERARGLMYRRELAPGNGMLFIYDSPRAVSFWMRNTYIPLDLVFLDQTGTIRHIHRKAVPLDETPIPGAAPGDPRPERQMILEIGGGEAERLGLKVGQPMAHPRLQQDLASLPCG
ncbi:DUF192 domain-containing protein [Paracoccus benzoatiresistens]|uniref:DUF192 domain-containing protein n=1 Tax=Paracoccus benzoatiresistens TaxID=2997341 RepID=A0ABT4J3P4_9RHOB|nr:DUF192 domain-containing protein [Paracoccus sp. EF6]MCZ0961265.1 DUF192 domain-containing protein [Paracoccus sp. EF6]